MAHVLIVEDEPVLRMTFEDFLEEEGYEVSATTSYQEAFDCLNESEFDVVVSDIILGGHSGIDLLRAINERKWMCQVIMITGDPTVSSAGESVRLGAFDYLPKPVTEHDLKRVVRLAVDRRRIETERDQYRSDLDAIFNSVNSAIVMADRNLRLRQANEAARELLDLADDYRGRPVDGLFSAGLASVKTALATSAKTGKSIEDVRVEVETGDGSRRVYVANTAPLLSSQGRDGALAVLRDVTRLTYLEAQAEEQHLYRAIVGKSRSMREVFQLVEDLSEADSTVLICGESGTGKELVAEAVHESSARSGKAFLKVNCAALSEEILESELFGHVRGAFTGAVKDRVGRFQAANGGTLFLDEIGDISPRVQLRLLRVLQSGEFERVGDSTSLRVDVRIIAATNQDLLQKIRAGEFRQDLYYRLNVIRIDIPPLRDRKEDIPLLVDHFIRHFNTRFKKEIVGLSPETLAILMQYPWLGNVRELENCLERAFIVCRDTIIQPHCLPTEIAGGTISPAAFPFTAPTTHSERGALDREKVLSVLCGTDWNVAKSARKLGVARNTLYQKMKHYGLSRPNAR